MQKQSYEVEVLINGKPAKEYAHKGNIWIEGRNGTKFSIRMRNNSWDRKLFVPTVDGLSVLDGEEGSFKSGGYIVNGHSSVTIDGWRISDEKVASFFFSSPEKSYRKRMKKGNNLGVIGVAVFQERYNSTSPTWTYNCTEVGTTLNPNSIWTTTMTSGINVKELNLSNNDMENETNFVWNGNSSSVMMSSLNSGSSAIQKLGTGWGEQKTSEVTTVEFERSNYPESIFEIRYNTREELEKEGIDFKKEPLFVTPQAFPGQYCKPPQTCSCDGVRTGCSDINCPSRN